MFAKDLRSAIVLFLVMTVITGVAYPLVVTGIATVVAPQAAGGSLVERDGQVVGSMLIGQAFSAPKYFWGRPSATSPMADNGGSSSGSNLGPTNSALTDAVKDRIKALTDADPDNHAPIPVDLVSSSASGLDPEISPAAALYQAGRVARARGLPVDHVRALVDQYTQDRTLGVLGEPRVNVLALNLALDAIK
jgi:potassium-transporting ATPase KdpC subunit